MKKSWLKNIVVTSGKCDKAVYDMRQHYTV